MPRRGPFVEFYELPTSLQTSLLPTASHIESIRYWTQPRMLVKIVFRDGTRQKWKFYPNKPSDGSGMEWRQVQ